MDLELQKALFKLFQTLKFPFYEGLGDENFPYGTLTYTVVEKLNTKTTQGLEVTYQLNLFSKYNGTLEVKRMADEVIKLLEKPFDVNGKECVLNDWNFRIQREDDVHHGILESVFKLY